MNDTDRERTGGTSSGDASGNPPVVSSPAFKTNRQILDELLSDGFRDAATPEASHILEHVRRDGVQISVPTSKKEVPIGTYRKIAKTAGWL